MISRQIRTVVLLLAAVSPVLCAERPHVQGGMLVSTESLAHLVGNPSVVVLHVARDRASYDQGHIPGARLLLLHQIAVMRDGNDNELPTPDQLKEVFENAGISNNSKVVIYDDAQGMLAARCWFTLDFLGLGSKASILDGGMTKWTAEGRALLRDNVSAGRGNLTITPRNGVVISYAQMLQAAKGPAGVVIIDARAPQQFGDGAGRGSAHIKGAHNVFWMDTLVSGSNPVLKSAEVVRKAYGNAGVKPDSRVIVYCNSGMQASHAYFTLRWLGYQVALYDGSFHEWTRHPEAPVE